MQELPSHAVRGTSRTTLIVFDLLIAACPIGGALGQSFTNVAAVQGVDILTNTTTYGCGVSFFDFNNDGWDDLSFCMRGDSARFYLNVEGTLQEQTPFLPILGDMKHVLWVDYDNDGDNDLFTTSFSGMHKLFRNDGQFNFTDVSVAAGLIQSNEKNFGASWGDYDRDGYLDLYVCTYEFEGTSSDYTRLNHLYRNNGDGTFTDVTMSAGVGNGIRLSFQSVWFDYDLDGWPDLFIINDRLYANTLYRNNGDGTFTDVTDSAGIGFPFNDPMTITLGDLDNDGDLDIFITNTGTMPDRACKLLVNNGDGTFTDMAETLGVDVLSWTWGGIWMDYDNDTFQDLYFASGVPIGPIDHNYFFRNIGGLVFADSLAIFTGDHSAHSYSCARGDLDNNGFYDIVVHNLVPYHPYLWQNSGGPNAHIKFTLQGTVSNRPAIGSWIRVFAGGQQYTQYTLCGENFVGQNSQHHIFGLGQLTQVDSVEVEYVSGHIDTYFGPTINQAHHFTEGETYQASIQALGPLAFCAGDTVILDAGDHAAWQWNTGDTSRYLAVTSGGTYWVVAQNQYGVSAQSDSVVVEVFPTPQILVDVSMPSCAGSADGTIALENLSGPAAGSVIWNNGAQGAEIGDLPAGMVSYTYVDTNGCSTTGQVVLIEPDGILVQVSIVHATSADNGALSLVINGGIPPYQVTLDGVPVADPIEGLSPGIHQLLVSDANGCIWEAEVFIDDHTDIPERNHLPLLLSPNPAQNEVFLKVPERLEEVTVSESGGRIVRQIRSAFDGRILIGDLAPGSYNVVARTACGKKYAGTLVKQP